MEKLVVIPPVAFILSVSYIQLGNPVEKYNWAKLTPVALEAYVQVANVGCEKGESAGSNM